jgi:hypothetical protein
MPTPQQTQELMNAVTSIRSAEQILVTASNSMTDQVQLLKLNIEYQHLDSYLSQLLHAQALSDDSQFSTATTALQSQADALAADETAIQNIVSDVGTAAKVVQYIAEAVGFIAKI